MKKKFYKKAKVKEVRKLPSNYRGIPEKLNRDGVVFLVGILAILLAMLIISMDLYTNIKRQKALNQERVKILSEISFWENEVKQKPNYRDAYFSLALLNFQLKDFDKAEENLKKTLSIDPNFEKGREFEKLLRNF